MQVDQSPHVNFSEALFDAPLRNDVGTRGANANFKRNSCFEYDGHDGGEAPLSN